MRFSFNILAVAALLSSTVLAYEHNVDAIIARHEFDNERVEARGIMTEFETRALLVSRAPPNGDCSTGSPEHHLSGPQCAQRHGYGWKFNGRCYGPRQMLLQGNTVKGICYY